MEQNLNRNNILKFPNNLQSIRDIMSELLLVLESGCEDKWYAFVTLEDLKQKSVRVSNVEDLSRKSDRGIVMRIVVKGRNLEYATNSLERDYLVRKANELRKRALNVLNKRGSFPVYKPLSWQDEGVEDLSFLMRSQLPEKLSSTTQIHFGTLFVEDPEKESINDMLLKARDFRTDVFEKFNKDITVVFAILNQKIRTKIFIDRTKNMSQSLLTSLSYLYAVTPKGRTSRVIRGGLGGFETACINGADIQNFICIANKIDGAELLKPGRYKIVTGPDVTGVIAHEAFGHTQEGDTCRYGRSCAPRIRFNNERVGNDNATIINNAAVFNMGNLSHGQNGSHFFDDEGQLSRPHIILDKGYLGTPMNDLLSSLYGDINGTAERQSNGKRESWRNPIMARQTNTYFTPGEKTFNDLISMVDYGFLAEYAYGGMEDPKGMGLTAGTQYLEEIQDGRLTGRVFLGPKGGHVELSDPVPLLLNNIIAKSRVDDSCFASIDEQPFPYNKWGGCGKYHKELVEAGSGGPFILWDGINCG